MSTYRSLLPVRGPRSTRAEILARALDVQRLVDELKKAQQRNWTILANCIERCHAASVHRAGWRSSSEAMSGTVGRYRCKTIACPGCGAGMWRKAVRKTLDRFHDVDAEDLTVATIAGPQATDMDAVRVEVRRMRRSLRDLRDAQAERRPWWRDVRIAGLADLMPAGDHGAFLVQPVARLLVHHPRVPRSSVERVMRDWFAGSGRDVDVGRYREDAFWGLPPGVGLPMAWRAAVVAALFEWHRGTEPFRVAVGAQRQSAQSYAAGREDGRMHRADHTQPMPVILW